MTLLLAQTREPAHVSIQLVSLASREFESDDYKELTPELVSIQLVSLASRENYLPGDDQNFIYRFHSIGFPSE